MHFGEVCFVLIVLHLVLVVDVGSCLQQSLNSLNVSIQGSYPQRNITTLMRERNCELISSELGGQ